MNRFLNKIERKISRYAIRNLTMVLIGCFIIGYMVTAIRPEIVSYMALDPYYILKGQIWRIFTWIVIPPNSFNIFTLIMLMFYFSIGTTLEHTWGTARYNIYIFGGMLISLLAAFITYFIISAIYGQGISFGGAFSTYYICMSMFLAYAFTYPEHRVLLMFVIPIKVKWLGIVYAVYIVYDCISYIRYFVTTKSPVFLVMIVAVVASVANFILFFFATRNYRKIDPREIRRKQQFRREMELGRRDNAARTGQNAFRGVSGHGTGPVVNAEPAGIAKDGTPVFTQQPTRHRCCICGRTEVTNPELTFRYCSKCAGAREYCQDHLFTHQHVTEE